MHTWGKERQEVRLNKDHPKHLECGTSGQDRERSPRMANDPARRSLSEKRRRN